MPADVAIVVSDAHLGAAAHDVAPAFHRFLEAVPDLASHLVINGDLFEFWFEYRSVIPRAAFGTLAALAAVRRAGVRLTVTGGNHDRWGGAFWREELGATFHADAAQLELAGWPALVTHGDRVAEPDRRSRLLGMITRHRWTQSVFRALHPDAGLALVRRLGPVLGRPVSDIDLERAAAAQRTAARALLAQRPDLAMVVMGHTHRPVIEPCGEGRWYVNPGAWLDGFRYARVTRDGPALARFEA